MNSLKNHIDKFEKNVLPIEYHRRGILPSEGFVICALTDLHKIDILVESGIANGMSTEIFAKYGIPKIIGIERSIKPKEVEMFASTKKRLEKYKNVTIIKGDSFDVLPKIISENKNYRIGVIIDGPKGTAACNLLRSCMGENNVIFGAINDQRQKEMKKFFKEAVFTDDKQFSEFDYLDKKIGIPKPIYGIIVK